MTKTWPTIQHNRKNGAYVKTMLHTIESHTYSPCPKETFVPSNADLAATNGSMGSILHPTSMQPGRIPTLPSILCGRQGILHTKMDAFWSHRSSHHLHSRHRAETR